ncbi:MAG: UDP-N-acetylglucosamine 2-epimerase (non-hydrolyzing) [Myxococcales bacterium]|nr:UDP-N-acetylglucosamine 2-epimerase (non-hydrolyzing) [Myxococcales bacterium]
MLQPKKITCVVGARPNFMKVAPVVLALKARGLNVRLVHTGQHYDARMSAVFFDDLGMPRPDAFLEVGSATHAVQTARVLERFDADCTEFQPELVLVAGDVNSTIACAMVAAKRGIAVGHIEAGLRSRDWAMPEEINRILTDNCSDLLLTPSADGDENLRAEGVPEWRIHRVGNLMIDSLRRHLERALTLKMPETLGLEPGGYVVVTLHRPSNVDVPEQLEALLAAIGEVSERMPVVFPIHPRTRARIADANITVAEGVRLVEPLGYLQFLGLMAQCKIMLTDSGGIQEETTALGVPCLTLRDNTERPITVDEGTNTLLGAVAARVVPAVDEIVRTGGKQGRIPDLWDGKSAERVADLVCGGFRTMLGG